MLPRFGLQWPAGFNLDECTLKGVELFVSFRRFRGRRRAFLQCCYRPGWMVPQWPNSNGANESNAEERRGKFTVARRVTFYLALSFLALVPGKGELHF